MKKDKPIKCVWYDDVKIELDATSDDGDGIACAVIL